MSEPAARPRYRSDLNILIGRTCNAACAHCSIDSSPRNKLRMSERTLAALPELIAGFAAWSPGGRLVFTGGEPFLFRTALESLCVVAHAHGLRVAVETNGYWAKDGALARKTLTRYGIDCLLLSTSVFHQRYVAWDRVIAAFEAARALGIDVTLRIAAGGRDDAAAERELIHAARAVAGEALEIQPVLPFGRGADCTAAISVPSHGPLLCPSDGMIVLDSGRIDPCCNSLNALADHSLTMGSAAECGGTATARLDDDIVFRFIRERGVRALYDRLTEHGAVMEPLPDEACSACARIFGDPRLAPTIAAFRSGCIALDGQPSPSASGT